MDVFPPRFVPAPEWPTPPPGFRPAVGWRPDPAWPTPPGWKWRRANRNGVAVLCAVVLLVLAFSGLGIYEYAVGFHYEIQNDTGAVITLEHCGSASPGVSRGLTRHGA